MHERDPAIHAVRDSRRGRPCSPATGAELHAQHGRTCDHGRAPRDLMDSDVDRSRAGYWVGLLLAVPAAGFLVRLFMIQHDCGHGSFFHRRRANDWVGRVIGVLTLTPYDFWRHSHALHHAKLGQSRSPWILLYRLYRQHPIRHTRERGISVMTSIAISESSTFTKGAKPHGELWFESYSGLLLAASSCC
jgi:Fatty acid desaturase